MDAPKTYEIHCLADIAAIPIDRLDAFLADLRASLLALDPQYREHFVSMFWIDDGLVQPLPHVFVDPSDHT